MQYILSREMSKGIDDILLDWHRKPTLNDVIALQVQSVAGAIFATSDRGRSLHKLRDGLDAIVVEIQTAVVGGSSIRLRT